MSKRQVIILWSIAAVLAVIVTLVSISQQDPTESATKRAPGETLLEDFPAAEVASIHIEGADRAVTLKQSADTWVVAERDDYPADTRAVLDFLRTLENLKVTLGIEAGPSFAPRFGMKPDSKIPEERGLTATFKDAGGELLATVSLGKNIESNSNPGIFGGSGAVGRYVRNHADESGFYATSELFPSIATEAADWLNSDFISPEKIKSVTLSKADSDEAEWQLARDSEEAEFQLVGGAADEVANASNTTPLKSLFSYARFNDVIPAAEVEARRAESGTRHATLETFEGFTYRFAIIPQQGVDDIFMFTVDVAAELPAERNKAADESDEDAKAKDEAFAKRLESLQDKLAKAKTFQGRTFELRKTTLSALLKERSEMVTKAEPKEDEAAAEDGQAADSAGATQESKESN